MRTPRVTERISERGGSDGNTSDSFCDVPGFSLRWEFS